MIVIHSFQNLYQVSLNMWQVLPLGVWVSTLCEGYQGNLWSCMVHQLWISISLSMSIIVLRENELLTNDSVLSVGISNQSCQDYFLKCKLSDF